MSHTSTYQKRPPSGLQTSMNRKIPLRSMGKPMKTVSPILARVNSDSRDRIVFDYLNALGTPRALSVWLLFKNNEHKQVVELSVDSMHYCDKTVFIGAKGPQQFRDDYAATKFLSKCVGLNTGIDTKGVAIRAAEKAESLCLLTNKRLILESRGLAVMPDVVQRNFFRITSKISRILGEIPSSFEDMGWSPGRTSSAWGEEISSMHKYTSQLDVTLSSRPAATRLLRESPSWGAAALDSDGPVSVLSSALVTVKGNTMITVPKNAKTDRVICFEPHMNIRLQRQVGDYIRSRLLKAGVNLNDQSVNRRRAILGSKTGHLATIDLSMASDTICRELIFQLLPIDWALKLDDLRSKYTLWPDGMTRKNEKFSSQGNGFTFELESLIFYALVSAVSENVSVYGDDIILASESFDDAKSVLEWAGFVLNSAKSFSVGNFRESCGADGFAGVDCSPVYLRVLPRTTEDVIHLHNRVNEWCSRALLPDPIFLLAMRKWRNVHTCFHGPSGYGDGHYHIDFDTALHRAGYQLDGWWFKTYARVTRVNRSYGDRVSGRYSGRYSWGALCASLGPKQVRDSFLASADRRQWFYKTQRGLASFNWPSVNWYYTC